LSIIIIIIIIMVLLLILYRVGTAVGGQPPRRMTHVSGQWRGGLPPVILALGHDQGNDVQRGEFR
jgi:hypothetical protein